MMHNVICEVQRPLKILISEIQDGGSPIRFACHEMSRLFHFQDGGCPPSSIFEIAVLLRDMFCITLPNFMDIGNTFAQISYFFAFCSEMFALDPCQLL